LLLNLEELSELLNNIDFDLGFVNGNKLRLFLFRHRLWRRGNCCWFTLRFKEVTKVTPKSSNFLIYANSFVNSRLNLHERGLDLLIKLTALSDCCNTSIGGKEEADRINFVSLFSCNLRNSSTGKLSLCWRRGRYKLFECLLHFRTHLCHQRTCNQ